jgi:sulfoxide reductase heme-binding subunit YedZ
MTNALWYAGRGAGIVSLILLTVVVTLGIATRSGRPAFGLPRFVVNALHANAALLAVSLLAVHVTSLLFDPYAQLRLVDLVLPFLGPYRPLWVGLGTVAFDLVIALVVTSLLRHRLGRRTWKAVHWLAYAAWPIAMLHGLFAGTDAASSWFRVVAVACGAAVGTAIAWRTSASFVERSEQRRAALRPVAARGREW